MAASAVAAGASFHPGAAPWEVVAVAAGAAPGEVAHEADATEAAQPFLALVAAAAAMMKQA